MKHIKTIRIILLVIIIIGVGLIFTRKIWLPPLISAIIEGQTLPRQVENTYPAIHPGSEMNSWDWIRSKVSSEGIQFSYPRVLPTQYISAQGWPPTVTVTSGEFSCGDNAQQGEEWQKQIALRTINGHEYCVSTSNEGAAGSTYTSYEYRTKQGDFITQVSFTLRTPQCLNYDDPEQSACQKEQMGFDADALADKIATSLRLEYVL